VRSGKSEGWSDVSAEWLWAQVTEADLAQWFQKVGRINDCRICSDMNACKRFAFVEFADKAGFEAGVHSPLSQHLSASPLRAATPPSERARCTLTLTPIAPQA